MWSIWFKWQKNKFQVTLDIAGYRRTRVNDDFKVLIFVKTVNSFAFIMDKNVWPEVLCGKLYKLSMPTIPPQLSLVLPFVSYNTDMQELTADIQLLHPEVVNVIRLKNRNQQVIHAVFVVINRMIFYNISKAARVSSNVFIVKGTTNQTTPCVLKSKIIERH